MARPDFRAAAARRLSEERELSPAIVSLLSPDSPTRSVGVRIVPIDRIEPNPEQPRLAFDEDDARRAGGVDPRARRPPADPRPAARPRTATSSIAGERRWRASKHRRARRRSRRSIEEIDDDTALEISIIENLQREDLSPLDEAAMYDRMVREHGYSIRKLADKLGKDKGYLENRLRLADAPAEIRELVSLRKDTPVPRLRADEGRGPEEAPPAGRPGRPRRADPDQAARARSRAGAPGRGDARRPRPPIVDAEVDAGDDRGRRADARGRRGPAPQPATELTDDSLVNAKQQLAEAVEELVGVLRAPDVRRLDRRRRTGPTSRST